MVQSINEVINRLSEIINLSINNSSRIGFFAALYKKVTVSVKEGIANGRFQDGARMEMLDINFANRYLDAYEQYQSGKPTTACWKVAFDTATQWKPLIIQHLLLGINAHINLDLGIAAQQTCPGEKLLPLHSDFEMINNILAELVQPMQKNLATISPWIGMLDKINPRTDDDVINFSMGIARNAAWMFALHLNSIIESEKQIAIQNQDQLIAQLAYKVAQPKGGLLNTGLFMIRLRESGNVTKVINVLE